MSVVDRIQELRGEAEEAISAAKDSGELEELRVRYLGRKAELTTILRGIADLDPSERGAVGKSGNEARTALEAQLAARRDELEAGELQDQLGSDRIDVTLPGSPVAAAGALNLLMRTRREIEDVFVGLGYRVMEGPEVELDYYNFTALNHPPGHPARMAQDTFYVDPSSLAAGAVDPPPGPEDVLLRTHTSPMQVRAMESQGPPIFIVVPGRCYRSDPFDATHSPVFHQVEGLAVGEDITLADLKGTLGYLARELFGADRETRFRTSFFPFTEPSVEVDVSCFLCGGAGCSVCKHSGWIEILGAGEVDQNVLEMAGLDTSVWQGFAFGMGIERIAFLKYGFPDLRMLYDNDLRFLEQFPA